MTETSQAVRLSGIQTRSDISRSGKRKCSRVFVSRLSTFVHRAEAFLRRGVSVQKKSAGDLGESPAGLSVSFSGGLGGFVLQDFCQPSPYRA